MDPLTAALILANTIAELIKLSIESQPAEVRAEFAKMQLEDFRKWRDFLDRFKIPKSEARPATRSVRKTVAKRRTPSRCSVRRSVRR